jgi:hypothetical protein
MTELSRCEFERLTPALEELRSRGYEPDPGAAREYDPELRAVVIRMRLAEGRRTNTALAVRLSRVYLDALAKPGAAQSVDLPNGVRVFVVVTPRETRLFAARQGSDVTGAEWREIVRNWHYDVPLELRGEPHESGGWVGLRAVWKTPSNTTG